MDGYNYYDPYSPAPQEGSQALSIVSLVLGIVAIVMAIATCCCYGVPGAVFGIASIICGIIAIATKKPGKGMAIAGIITGAASILVVIALVILILALGIAGESQSLSDAFWEGFEEGYNGAFIFLG